MIIRISNEYYAGATTEVDLEEDLGITSWSQVKGWYIKWGCLHYTLDGEAWKEYDLDESYDDCIDSKRPVNTTITDEDYKTIAEAE